MYPFTPLLVHPTDKYFCMYTAPVLVPCDGITKIITTTTMTGRVMSPNWQHRRPQPLSPHKDQ